MPKINWNFKTFDILYSHMKILFDFLEKTRAYVLQVYSTTEVLIKICEDQNDTLREIRKIIDEHEDELDEIDLYIPLSLVVDSEGIIDKKSEQMTRIKKGYSSLSGIPDVSQFGKANLPVYASFMVSMQSVLTILPAYLATEDVLEKEEYARKIYALLSQADSLGAEVEGTLKMDMLKDSFE